MGSVGEPVGGVQVGNLRGVHEDEVLGVVKLGCRREVERAGKLEKGINNHVIVVEERMGRVIEDRDIAYGEEVLTEQGIGA